MGGGDGIGLRTSCGVLEKRESIDAGLSNAVSALFASQARSNASSGPGPAALRLVPPPEISWTHAACWLPLPLLQFNNRLSYLTPLRARPAFVPPPKARRCFFLAVVNISIRS
jgi:hypothetical protein